MSNNKLLWLFLCFGIIGIIVIIVIKYKQRESYCKSCKGGCNKCGNPQNAFSQAIKVINVIENHGFPKSSGWVIDDGYPATTMIQFTKDPPTWVKSLTPYDRVFISTDIPIKNPYISTSVIYADKPQIGWITIGSGDQGEQELEKCCIKDGQVDTNAFYKKYGNRLMLEEGYTYTLLSDDKSSYALFWLGMAQPDPKKPPIQPYPVGTKMYI